MKHETITHIYKNGQIRKCNAKWKKKNRWVGKAQDIVIQMNIKSNSKTGNDK